MQQACRGHIVNLAGGTSMLSDPGKDPPWWGLIQFLVRPNEITQKHNVQYNAEAALYSTFENDIFKATGNVTWSFDLYCNLQLLRQIYKVPPPAKEGSIAYALGEGNLVASTGGATMADVREAAMSTLDLHNMLYYYKTGLEALTCPVDFSSSYARYYGATPPLCHLLIPGVVSAMCRLVALEFKFTDFDDTGLITEWTAACEFREAQEQKITMERHLTEGMYRGGGT